MDGESTQETEQREARGQPQEAPERGPSSEGDGRRDEEQRDDSGSQDSGSQNVLERMVSQGEPDVLLDVPKVKVDEIDIEVDELRARVSLHAAVGNLVKLDVGADVEIGRVKLTIRGVEAQALLKVRLEKVYAILERTLSTIDRNPRILEAVLKPVGETVGQLGKTVDKTVPELGKSVGKTVEETGPQLGKSVGKTVEEAGPQLGKSVGKTVEETGPQLGKSVGKTVEETGPQLGQSVGDTVEKTAPNVGKSVGDTVGQTVPKVGEGVEGAGQAVGQAAGQASSTRFGQKIKQLAQTKGARRLLEQGKKIPRKLGIRPDAMRRASRRVRGLLKGEKGEGRGASKEPAREGQSPPKGDQPPGSPTTTPAWEDKDVTSINASARARELRVDEAIARVAEGRATTRRVGLPPGGAEKGKTYRDVEVGIDVRGHLLRPVVRSSSPR